MTTTMTPSSSFTDQSSAFAMMSSLFRSFQTHHSSSCGRFSCVFVSFSMVCLSRRCTCLGPFLRKTTYCSAKRKSSAAPLRPHGRCRSECTRPNTNLRLRWTTRRGEPKTIHPSIHPSSQVSQPTETMLEKRLKCNLSQMWSQIFEASLMNLTGLCWKS